MTRSPSLRSTLASTLPAVLPWTLASAAALGLVLVGCGPQGRASAPAEVPEATPAEDPTSPGTAALEPEESPAEPTSEALPPNGASAGAAASDAAPPPQLWEAFHFPLAPLGACAAGRGLQGPWGGPEVLGSEAEFQRVFCAPSRIDWSSSRLVVWVQTRNSPNTVVEGASLEGEKLVVRWKRHHFCHGANYGRELWASAAKISAAPAVVESVVAETPAPNCQNVP